MKSAKFLKKIVNLGSDKNQGSSQRLFAQKVGISAGMLSDILRGKRVLSMKVARRIATIVELSASQRKEFFSKVEADYLQHQLEKSRQNKSSRNTYFELSQETFERIGDWQHFALVNLISTKDFKFDPAWISKRLGISVDTTKKTIQTLLDTGLVKEEAGKLSVTYKNITTSDDIPNESLARAHKLIIQKALDAFRLPVDDRCVTNIMFPANKTKLKKAKVMIKEFRRKMNSLLEDDHADEVFCMSVQLFPISRS